MRLNIYDFIISGSYFIFVFSLFNHILDVETFNLVLNINLLFILSLLINSVLIVLYVMNKIKYHISLSIFLIIIQMNFSLIIIDKLPSFTYQYLSFGYTDFVLRHHRIDPSTLSYQNWPGIMFLMSNSIIIMDMKFYNILIIYQIYMKIVSILAIFYILKQFKFSKNSIVLILSIYIIGEWTAKFYATPPSFGSILLLFSLIILLKNKKDEKMTIIFIILSSSLIISHLLSSLVFLSIMIGYLLFQKYKIRKRSFRNYIPIYSILLIIFNVIIISDFFKNNFSLFIENLFNLTSIFKSTETSTINVGELYSNMMKIKIFTTLIYSFMAFMGILISFKHFKKNLKIFLILSSILILPIFVGAYSGEIVSRVFGYSSVFLAIYFVFVFRRKYFKYLVIILIFILPIFSYVSSYGNYQYDRVSNQEINGCEYIWDYSNTSINITVISERIIKSRYIENVNIEQYDFEEGEMEYNSLKNSYLTVNDRDIEGSEYLFNLDYHDLNEKLDRYENDMIYNNGEYKIKYYI